MGGDKNPPPQQDPKTPQDPTTSQNDPLHISLGVPAHLTGFTPSPDSNQLTIQSLAQRLEERDAELARMRAQMTKLSEAAKSKGVAEVSATTQRRSAKDRLGHPIDVGAQKALVHRNRSPSIEHLTKGHRVRNSHSPPSQVSRSSARSPYTHSSASHETVYYMENGQFIPIQLKKNPTEKNSQERSVDSRRKRTPPRASSFDARQKIEANKKARSDNSAPPREGGPGRHHHTHEKTHKSRQEEPRERRPDEKYKHQSLHRDRRAHGYSERPILPRGMTARPSDGVTQPPLPSVDERLKQLSKSPFTKEISVVTLPSGFSLPKVQPI